MDEKLNRKVIERGKEFFASIRGEKASVFNKSQWIGKVMDWSMKNDEFKTALFRFVDVFPSLNSGRSLTAHIKEYFGSGKDIPAVLKLGAAASGIAGDLGAGILNKSIAANMKGMATAFIAGEDTKSAIKNLTALRKQGFTFVVDVLGEASVTEAEADKYMNDYLELLDALGPVAPTWKAVDSEGDLDWGHAPKVSIAVKPTALFSLSDPKDFEGSVEGIAKRMRTILKKTMEVGGFLCVDMESHKHKDITLAMYKKLKEEFPDYPHFGIVLQSYLKETDRDLTDLIAWARKLGTQLPIRLVKGAYWDYETVLARQNGWEIPVYHGKHLSDAAFERHAAQIFDNADICSLQCASHNIRSIAAVEELARSKSVPESRYEYQVLYGMAEPVRNGLKKIAKRIRLYTPYGDLIPGMAYLVRRLLENTSNDSFLRQTFAESEEEEKLLADPAAVQAAPAAAAAAPRDPDAILNTPFTSEPMADFTRPDVRIAFEKAIAKVRGQLGKTYPVLVGGKPVETGDTIDSVNPNNPDELIGRIHQGGTAEVDAALASAKKAFPAWRDTPARERAVYLIKAAGIMRKRLYELAAWQVLEVGKQWDQAYADVTEAIDFLEYYAREMTRIGEPQKYGDLPGEDNRQIFEPKGVAAVIAPWNFPLAISTGMTSAAIVSGNPVIYKPSSLSSVIGYTMAEIYKEAGLPEGVFTYLPGRSSVMGDYLVDSPDISLIAFTGSKEVGLRILQRAAVVHPGQGAVKKVVCEMGGKNAIIVDDDANLDEAVPGVIYSAFAFQGQKCSACSRVIVLEEVYDRFIERLLGAAQALLTGPSEDPAHYLGAVVDSAARDKILSYVELGKKEGEILFQAPAGAPGFFVPPTIVGGITPEHRIAQEEIFGPVLSVLKAKDFDQAIEWANSTAYALTGGLFSRSPAHIERARREFRVGNLYINRGSTGALVGRQPFGGAGMSGGGTKAGGREYLLHFVDPRVITENTMRRGFTPDL